MKIFQMNQIEVSVCSILRQLGCRRVQLLYSCLRRALFCFSQSCLCLPFELMIGSSEERRDWPFVRAGRLLKEGDVVGKFGFSVGFKATVASPSSDSGKDSLVWKAGRPSSANLPMTIAVWWCFTLSLSVHVR